MNIEEEAAAAAKTLSATHARRSADPERSLARAIVSDLSKPADPLSWEAINAVGRVVFAHDGRPIRTIVTGRRRIVTGFYVSRKAGRRQPHEGMNEQAFYMHCEVDTDVIDYRAQPFRFEFVLDGAKRIYIADCVRLLHDGKIEVVEVKNDRRALKDFDYASKLEVVREICGQLGWSFRVVTRDQMLRPAVRHANIVEVQSRRLVTFEASHTYVASEVIDRHGGAAPLGAIAEKLGDRRLGAAMVKAMMVRRLVCIDLSRAIDADSCVSAIGPAAPSPARQGGVR